MQDFWTGFNEAAEKMTVMIGSGTGYALRILVGMAIVVVLLVLFFGMSALYYRMLHSRMPVLMLMIFSVLKWIILMPQMVKLAVCVMNGVVQDFVMSSLFIGVIILVYFIACLVHFFWQRPWEETNVISGKMLFVEWSMHLDVCIRELFAS